jgi:hypothetical protein
MYTQSTDYTTGASTANYTTQQYQYQYQYQMPTTTQTTTTTQQFTTSTDPVSYTQQFTTSQPVSYTQSYTTQPQTYTTQQTTYTTSVPGRSTAVTNIPGFSTGVAIRPQPAFKLLRQGAGISPTEQQGIVSTAMLVYQHNITPISNNTASRIKKTLGGDWIVIVYPQGKPIDFNMTCVQGNDYMYFTLDNTAYQVCRLR